MKHITLLIFSLLAISFVSKAQQGGTKIKFHKDRPVQILEYSRLWDPNATSTSKRKLRKSDRFTDAEVDEIFRRLGQDALLPKDIYKTGLQNKAALAHYKAYEQSSFSLLGYDFSLVWIPKDENAHMPAELQPPTSEGSLWYTSTQNLSKNGKSAAGATLAKAGTPVSAALASSANGSIQHSTADMSGFTRNFLGCLAITYSDMGFLNVVPVYGAAFNAEKDAPAIGRRYDMATSYHKYQWFPGRPASSLEREFGRSMTVRVLESYTIE